MACIVVTSTRFLAQSRTCPHPGVVTLYVQDGKFYYRWDYATWVDGSIDPDGAVHGQGDRYHVARQARWQAHGRGHHQRPVRPAFHRDVARFVT